MVLVIHNGGVLEDDESIDRTDIQKRIIYGKHGFENKELGRLETCLFWNDVKNNYSHNQLIFLFGGDKMRNLSVKKFDRYTHDLIKCSTYVILYSMI